MAKTSHGTDLQAAVLADTSGDFGAGSTVSYTLSTSSASSGASGYIFAYANSNVIYTYIGTTLANITGWYPGMLLTLAGTMTGFPSGATIVSNPATGVYVLSQYTTAALGNTAGTGALSGSNYITASGNLITDSAKNWTAAAGAQIGSSNIGVPGQWAGKTVTAGTGTLYTVPSTISITNVTLGSTTVSVGTSYTINSTGGAFVSSMIGGILNMTSTTSVGLQFVITAVGSGTSLTATCLVGGIPNGTPTATIDYGLFQATVLSNTAQVLVVDAWKSMALQNTPTSTAAITHIPLSSVTIAANSPYVINDGGSPSYYMALSQDTTNVTANEQYLTSSYTGGTSVTVAAATTVNSTVSSAPGNTVGTSYSVTGGTWTAAILGGTATTGTGCTYLVTAAGTSTATLLCTAAGTSPTTTLVINYYTCTGSGTTFPSTCAGGILMASTSQWLITYYSSATALTVVPISGSLTASGATAYNISYNATSGTNYAEQTTNGLSRAICTYAHTKGSLGGNTTYTLSKAFTYTGASATAVNKVGIFNASQGGVMMFTTALPAVATLAQSSDTLTVTETVTLS